MNLQKFNKALIFLLCCCFGLVAQAQEVEVSGTVYFSLNEEPAPGYPVWLEIIGADGSVFGIDAATDEAGEYDVILDFDFPPGEEVVLFVRSFDFCNGDELELVYTVSEENAVVEGADFYVCANIDPPDPEDSCEAFFEWTYPTDDPLVIQFLDVSFAQDDITSWSWMFGDGNGSDEQNPTHTYAEPGDYEVILTITTDSCTSTIVQFVWVGEMDGCDCPEYYDPVCVVENGDTLTFDNICFALCEDYAPDQIFECGEDPCACDLDYDPVCVITPGGFILEFSNACFAECAGYGEDSFVECEFNEPDCQAMFYVNQEDFNSLTVEFVDISFSSEGEIIAWEWDFGDGNFSDEQNPIHTYDEPGIYDITLTIVTADGCTSITVQHICIGLINDCDCPAEYDPVCVELEEGIIITFPNACEAECAGFGEDAQFECDGNPNECPCDDNFDPVCVQLDNGEIILFPNACYAECEGYGEDSFVDCEDIGCVCPDVYDPVCVTLDDGTVISFPNACYAECEGYGEDSIEECEDTGDCDCPDIYDPVCAVTETGEILTFPNLCIALTCENIAPDQLIDCDGNTDPCVCPDIYAPVCVETEDGEVISFVNACYAECEGYGEDSFVDCDFDTPCDCPFIFDPVCVLTENGEIFVFENACIAECEGYGEDSFFDCEDGNYDGCYASFYIDFVTDNPLEVSFIDDSYGDEGEIISWSWDFGDGNVSDEQNPTHLYDEEGVYEVTLTIVTSDGCEATTVQHICIGDGGVFDGPDCQAFFFFEFDEENTNTFHFQDLSLGEVQSWSWDFGDGNGSDEQNPSHTYEEAGIYLVTLTITTEDCESTASMLVISNEDIIYNNECTALFLPFIIADSNQVFLLNLSSPDAISFDWDLGDGTMSTEPILIHQYEEPGVYEISLTITTADGCTNTFSVTIDIEDDNFTGNPSYLTVTSTQDVILENSLRLYPNPVRETLNLDLELTTDGLVQFSIIGLDGKRHSNTQQQLLSGEQNVKLNTNELAPGIYFVRMQTQNAVKSLKFVKQ
jgi:PKD repeat protein